MSCNGIGMVYEIFRKVPLRLKTMKRTTIKLSNTTNEP